MYEEGINAFREENVRLQESDRTDANGKDLECTIGSDRDFKIAREGL